MTASKLTVFAGMAGLAFSLACGSAPAEVGVEAEPAAGPLELSELVMEMRDMAWAEEVDAAQALIEGQRPHHDTASPRWLLAASWLGRGAGFAERWDVAERYASEARDGSVALLAERDLDADNELPLALGAGIEVLSRVHDARGDRAGGVEFLTAERERYRGTSIETRIQKNVLLLEPRGPAVPRARCRARPRHAAAVGREPEGEGGRRVLLGPLVPRLQAAGPRPRAAPRRLRRPGPGRPRPTQLYGYVQRGEDATPEQELAYLRGAYQERFPIPSWMSAPVSQRNFLEFGVSTTPTLVVIDREGIVRLYNPGDLPYEELAPHVERLL